MGHFFLQILKKSLLLKEVVWKLRLTKFSEEVLISGKILDVGHLICYKMNSWLFVGEELWFFFCSSWTRLSKWVIFNLFVTLFYKICRQCVCLAKLRKYRVFSFKLVCNFEIAGSVSRKLYFPSRCSVTASGDVQSASSETIWKCWRITGDNEELVSGCRKWWGELWKEEGEEEWEERREWISEESSTCRRCMCVGCGKDIKIGVIVSFRRRWALRYLLPVSSTKIFRKSVITVPNIIDLFEALVQLITILSALIYFLYGMPPTWQCHAHSPNKKSSWKISSWKGKNR